MSQPARYVAKPLHDGLGKPIKEQLSYFRQFVGCSEDLIKACADVVHKDDRQLSGTKFPVGLIAEALGECEQRTGIQEFAVLKLDLHEHLAKSYANSGFNYFNEPYLPEDLDTASTLARLLGRENFRLRADYDQIIKRNRLPGGIVPTWLDTSDHARWFSGTRRFHLDVLLNHWLTETELGRPIKKEVLCEIVQSYGLRNYWYLPPLYTPYLYCRLIRRMGLNRDSRFVLPLKQIIELWRKNPMAFHRYSNTCPYEKMDMLLAEQPLSSRLDAALQRTILVCCDEGHSPEVSDVETEESSDWGTPLYWSLGFKAFVSEPVNRAVVLLSLLNSI